MASEGQQRDVTFRAIIPLQGEFGADNLDICGSHRVGYWSRAGETSPWKVGPEAGKTIGSSGRMHLRSNAEIRSSSPGSSGLGWFRKEGLGIGMPSYRPTTRIAPLVTQC